MVKSATFGPTPHAERRMSLATSSGMLRI
jgi:hypothetical protein